MQVQSLQSRKTQYFWVYRCQFIKGKIEPFYRRWWKNWNCTKIFRIEHDDIEDVFQFAYWDKKVVVEEKRVAFSIYDFLPFHSFVFFRNFAATDLRCGERNVTLFGNKFGLGLRWRRFEYVLLSRNGYIKSYYLFFFSAASLSIRISFTSFCFVLSLLLFRYRLPLSSSRFSLY